MDYTSGYVSAVSSVPVIYTDDSTDDDLFDERQRQNLMRDRLRSEEDSQDLSSCSSQGSSSNDISDTDRLTRLAPRGLRPPPQVVSAQSLPNLLLPNEGQSPGSPPNGYVSSLVFVFLCLLNYFSYHHHQ